MYLNLTVIDNHLPVFLKYCPQRRTALICFLTVNQKPFAEDSIALACPQC